MLSWLSRLLPGQRASDRRWVVVDVETSGMDTASDRLISVGAVAMSDGRVVPADSIEMIIQQGAASSRDNILIHGVGAAAQRSGIAPSKALGIFLEYVGRAPLLAFHAPFDRAFLARSIRYYVNQPFDNPWLDLAELAPVVDAKSPGHALDDWLQHYGITIDARHSAAADAFATALLAARLLAVARHQGATDFESLQRLARSARWLR